MARGDAFVAEVAVDFENLFETTDHQTFQVELRRDAQIKLHVERVVMGDEGACRGAAGDRVHHRRFDFEEAALQEQRAHRLDDARAQDEIQPRVFVADEIDVTLAIFLFLIGEAVIFLWQRTQ